MFQAGKWDCLLDNLFGACDGGHGFPESSHHAGCGTDDRSLACKQHLFQFHPYINLCSVLRSDQLQRRWAPRASKITGFGPGMSSRTVSWLGELVADLAGHVLQVQFVVIFCR